MSIMMRRTSYHLTIDIRHRTDKRGYQHPVDDSLCSAIFSATEHAINFSSYKPARGSFHHINLEKANPKNLNMIVSILSPSKNLPVELDNLLGSPMKSEQSVYEEMPLFSFREYVQTNKEPHIRKQQVTTPTKRMKSSKMA